MQFGDLKTTAALEKLNGYLADKSYIVGYSPSQEDTAAFEAMKGAPPAGLPHLLRWYTQISSYGSERSKFPGSASGAAPAAAADDDDDDVDLFGSDDEDEAEKERIKAERVSAYNAKKAKKTAIIAKSSVLLDVKPWDDETDMKAMEAEVRKISMDGLVWGAGKLVPLAFGIKKLTIMCTVEDDKVSIEELTEKIEENEEFVQSVDIAAFNKI
ncbi:elongation factor 1-beta-like [Pollicipes pollicipes]|uniref:elongation factor 1-beta-like n=1 Tax=Pollicipes pollicipes TaxID=41117 RepID=UPI0018855B46|nr:elongation factor 1-beta-like [Pollicipes pollicipes]XP_037089993.1 elongation factor 1-beta-like [Pollicipes pollicipes]